VAESEDFSRPIKVKSRIKDDFRKNRSQNSNLEVLYGVDVILTDCTFRI
jgi:hypothetical protein